MQVVVDGGNVPSERVAPYDSAAPCAGRLAGARTRLPLVDHRLGELSRLYAVPVSGLVEDAPKLARVDICDFSRHDWSVEASIREALDAYLRGDTSLKDFRSWLLDRTLDNPGAPPVAHAIEYFIDEALSGSYTTGELKDELRALARVRAAELV